jgi:hypothetical protein
LWHCPFSPRPSIKKERRQKLTHSRKARWQKTYWSGICMEKARWARIQSTAKQ